MYGDFIDKTFEEYLAEEGYKDIFPASEVEKKSVYHDENFFSICFEGVLNPKNAAYPTNLVW